MPWKGRYPTKQQCICCTLHYPHIYVAAKVWCVKTGSASAYKNIPYILITYYHILQFSLNCGPQGQSLLFLFLFLLWVTHVPIATALPWWKSQHFQGLLSPYVTSVAIVVIGRSPARRWLAHLHFQPGRLRGCQLWFLLKWSPETFFLHCCYAKKRLSCQKCGYLTSWRL